MMQQELLLNLELGVIFVEDTVRDAGAIDAPVDLDICTIVGLGEVSREATVVGYGQLALEESCGDIVSLELELVTLGVCQHHHNVGSQHLPVVHVCVTSKLKTMNKKRHPIVASFSFSVFSVKFYFSEFVFKRGKLKITY